MSQPNPRNRRKSSVAKVIQQRLSTVTAYSYVKDMEFPADGPGRVIVRLERLMGSDRIRITDAKYMATLLQRLQEEEEITWQKRTRERRKAEHNRFRQLVIDGYTEPTPAMQDLYNHPVFRVNRILGRLGRLNHSVSPIINLPPIVPVDPFEYDDSGRVFKTYPGHFPFVKGSDRQVSGNAINFSSATAQVGQGEGVSIEYLAALSQMEESRGGSVLTLKPDKFAEHDEFDEEEYYDDEEEAEENMKGEFFSKLGTPKTPSAPNLTGAPSKVPSGHAFSQQASALHKQLNRLSGPAASASGLLQDKHLPTHAHIGFSKETPLDVRKSKGKASKDVAVEEVDQEQHEIQVLTLHEIQQIYGVATNTNLGAQWKPYQSPVVNTLFQDEKKGLSDLYKMGTAIVDMYDRQQQTTDHYIKSITRTEEKGEEGEVGDEEEELVDGNVDVRLLAEIGEFVSNISEHEDEEDENEPDLSYYPYSEHLTPKQPEAEGPPTWDNFEEELWEAPEEQVEDVEEEEEDE